MRHSLTSDTPRPSRAASSNSRSIARRPTKAGGTAGVQGSKGLSDSERGTEIGAAPAPTLAAFDRQRSRMSPAISAGPRCLSIQT